MGKCIDFCPICGGEKAEGQPCSHCYPYAKNNGKGYKCPECWNYAVVDGVCEACGYGVPPTGKPDTKAEVLAQEHWEYVKGLIDHIGVEFYAEVQLLQYVYKTAFVHGYKHGKEGK